MQLTRGIFSAMYLTSNSEFLRFGIIKWQSVDDAFNVCSTWTSCENDNEDENEVRISMSTRLRSGFCSNSFRHDEPWACILAEITPRYCSLLGNLGVTFLSFLSADATLYMCGQRYHFRDLMKMQWHAHGFDMLPKICVTHSVFSAFYISHVALVRTYAWNRVQIYCFFLEYA